MTAVSRIPISTQRLLLPLVGVLLQCLDEDQNVIDGAFASGFIRRENDRLFLYTCWHVVSGFDPNDVRIPVNHTVRRYLKIALQAARIRPGIESIGGLQTLVIPLYDNSLGSLIPLWLQDDQHIPHPILNDAHTFVPFWHDVVKIALPADLEVSGLQVVEERQTILRAGFDAGPGVKCLIVGFPYGFSSGGPEQPTPVVLTRFIAGTYTHDRRMQLLLESIGSPGMSGGPVFVETSEEIQLIGIYTGLIFPGYAGRISENSTAIGTVSDLRLMLRGCLRLTNSPSQALTRDGRPIENAAD